MDEKFMIVFVDQKMGCYAGTPLKELGPLPTIDDSITEGNEYMGVGYGDC